MAIGLGIFAKLKIPKIQFFFATADPTHPPPSKHFFWKPITDMDRTLKS